MQKNTLVCLGRIIVGVFFIVLILILLILNPKLFYRHTTEIGKYTIYHQDSLPKPFELRLKNVDELITKSELNDPNLRLKVCLNDGSVYPSLIQGIRGRAFGWGFFSIAVYRGNFDYVANVVELNGYKWNLEQLMAHEMAHCLQFNKFGILKSWIFKDYPDWKWEGYSEYMSRISGLDNDLSELISRLNAIKKQEADRWDVPLSDGTMAPISYYEYWILVKYCLEIKGMKYQELLDSSITRKEVEEEMSNWFQQQALLNDQ